MAVSAARRLSEIGVVLLLLTATVRLLRSRPPGKLSYRRNGVPGGTANGHAANGSTRPRRPLETYRPALLPGPRGGEE